MKVASMFVLLALLFAACAQQPAGGTGPIRIGVITPLTGDVATLGQGIANAAVLAADEINAEGGVNGRNIEIIVEDGRCNSRDAATAGNKLIALDGVSFIVGGSCSPETLAVAPMAEQSHVVMLSPVSSAPAVSQAGDYIFRDYPSDSFVGPFLAKYMYEELGLRTVAVFACMNDYCQGVVDSFSPAFSEYEGAQIVATERFDNEARDLRTQVTRINQANPSGILFVAFTEAGIVGLRQMEEMGLDVPVVGGDTFDDSRILTESGTAGEGLRYAVPYTPDAPDFTRRYQERFGVAPAAGTPQSYDAVRIFASVMAGGATTPEQVKDALYAMPPYQGVSGTIAFDENGDLKGAAYLVREYRGGSAVPVHTYIDGQLAAAE